MDDDGLSARCFDSTEHDKAAGTQMACRPSIRLNDHPAKDSSVTIAARARPPRATTASRAAYTADAPHTA